MHRVAFIRRCSIRTDDEVRPREGQLNLFSGWRCQIRDGKSHFVNADTLDWSVVGKDRDGGISFRTEDNNIRQR